MNFPRVNVIRPNLTCVETNGVEVWFSYQTPVAFRANGRLVVRENVWSNTTGRHLNLIDNGNKKERVSGEEFNRLWNDFSPGLLTVLA
jgi:hypothetical protein